ncbi:MAG: hypothetical protein DAHOPDDO_00129 [Ignavibacteriaceae bacterium]|jgi:hypothetical protein|nr:hypothetical protein [Ignavibacteriales bacterium]MBV6418919.1 hypothetical protein [Ignavibacteriaceae bacterium]MEB2297966.1 hypothetical protein [Ignavibacteria bacterium]GIK59706.1 MAG: hypothetical protein BroJett017_05960 [Ignavibacteriota bacterium]MCC7094953.1 hypothetical protein [Ignavibacteriaceae bacterium]
MNNDSKKYIEDFLDEFMQIEYHGRDHIVARAHYRDVFNQLLPKYIHPENETKKNILQKSEKIKTVNTDE